MGKKETKAIRASILSGLDISFQRLIKEKQKNNDELVFWENRKIVKIKALDL